jgi:hypothetical protein
MTYSKNLCLPLFCICVLIVSSGCLGPKKINKWVAAHYNENSPPPAKPAKANESITITSPLVTTGSKLSETRKKTSHLLPLLFYWQWDYKNTCVLNNRIPVNNFISGFNSYASKKGLRQKLHGQSLQLSVDEVPNTFAIDDKGHMIWVIVTTIGWEMLTVEPERTDLVVSYKLTQPNGETPKTGTIIITDKDKGIALKMFQSLRKKTGQYLENYDANITVMSKAVVDKLLTELQ